MIYDIFKAIMKMYNDDEKPSIRLFHRANDSWTFYREDFVPEMFIDPYERRYFSTCIHFLPLSYGKANSEWKKAFKRS